MRIWGLAVVLLAFGGLDLSAVRVWRSEAAVWAQAYRLAPTAPRAALNHAKSLFVAGNDAEARRVLAGAR